MLAKHPPSQMSVNFYPMLAPTSRMRSSRIGDQFFLGSNLGKWVGISLMCNLIELSTWFPIVVGAGIVHLNARTALPGTSCGRWISKFEGDPVCTMESRGVAFDSRRRCWWLHWDIWLVRRRDLWVWFWKEDSIATTNGKVDCCRSAGGVLSDNNAL